MTIKAVHSVSSFGVSADEPKRDEYMTKLAPTVPSSVTDMWESLSPDVRAALIASELKGENGMLKGTQQQRDRSGSSTPTVMSRASSSVSFFGEQSSSLGSSKEESEPGVTFEKCPVSGADVTLTPVERAPKNVFAFTKTHLEEKSEVVKTSSTTVTTTTKVVSTSRGWRNIFSLPISYDVNMVPHGTLFDSVNSQLLDVTGVHPEGYNTRFAVVDADVDALYGDKIRNYFTERGIELTVCVINGGEADKRQKAVDTILDDLCAYKLRRREPFLAIGGGCVLDIAGMAACLYRRGVPFVRVPTTLLAIVDASVGVKNGIDYCCSVTDETYKNRVGSFYAPSACLLDPAFIASQDARNISNGFGEILKLALVRSSDLFDLLESHGRTLVDSRFEDETLKKSGVSSRIIDLSIQIMLEELGPNLWESKLDRCVDYGHTFSKLLEMVPGADIMHGEAVNVDGFFCVVISYLRGYIDMDTVNRVFQCMKSLNLPTNSSDLKLELAWQSCKDAIEHRHGEQRIPLITEIGESICVSDITEEELERALEMMTQFEH
jgi:3-dehydroquinate synthase